MLQQIEMNSFEFQPMADFLLVKPDKVVTDEVSGAGIIIQHKPSVINRPCSGVVLAVGTECKDLEVADYVVFPDTDGIEVKFKDSDPNDEKGGFLLLRYKSIIGKLRTRLVSQKPQSGDESDK